MVRANKNNIVIGGKDFLYSNVELRVETNTFILKLVKGSEKTKREAKPRGMDANKLSGTRPHTPRITWTFWRGIPTPLACCSGQCWVGSVGVVGRKSHLVDHSRAVSADAHTMSCSFPTVSVHLESSLIVHRYPDRTALCGINSDTLSLHPNMFQARFCWSYPTLSASSREAQAV